MRNPLCQPSSCLLFGSLGAIASLSCSEAAVILENNYNDSSISLFAFTATGPAGSGNAASARRAVGEGVGGTNALRFDIDSSPTVADGFIKGGFSNLDFRKDPDFEAGSLTSEMLRNVRISFEMTVPIGTELDTFRLRGSGENATFVPNLTYESTVGFATVMLSGDDLLTGEINNIVQAMNAEDNSFMTFSFDFKKGSRTDDDFVVIDNFLMTTVDSAPVPEPSTTVLLLLGGLVFKRGRRVS